MSEFPEDLEGTYTCQVVEPGTEGTAIIPTRKGKEEEPEIDVVGTRVFNRIIFHFPVSEGHNRVDNRIAKVAKIIG